MGFWNDDKPEVKVRTTTTTSINPRKRRRKKGRIEPVHIFIGIVVLIILGNLNNCQHQSMQRSPYYSR